MKRPFRYFAYGPERDPRRLCLFSEQIREAVESPNLTYLMTKKGDATQYAGFSRGPMALLAKKDSPPTGVEALRMHLVVR